MSAFNQRRWPSGMPSLSACWRKAPAVRFIALEIRATGVFALECLRSSACCARDQATRFFDFLFVFLAFFAIPFSCCAGVLARKRSIGHPQEMLRQPFQQNGLTRLNRRPRSRQPLLSGIDLGGWLDRSGDAVVVCARRHRPGLTAPAT